jgi:two-component system LytT family sensor kinase
MTSHDFIFSDIRHHRVARHVIFWIVWSFAYHLFYQFPIHEFRGYGHWDPNTEREVQQIGAVVYFFRILLINSFLGVIVPQIAFVYVLFYWVLPHYFYRKRKTLLTLSVITGVIVVFLFVAAVFKWSAPIYLMLTGQKTTGLSLVRIFRPMLANQLVSFPIVVGLALTIKLIKRWWLKQKETEQVAKEKMKAELQLLKAQVHPHFLFNTLNNIYFFILSGSPKAPEMISKLSGLLHYILNECNQPAVSLEKEMKMIRDYASLEKIRYGDEMEMSVELPDNCPNKMIAPLLLIPFIENSFKHGASKVLAHPYVRLRIYIEGDLLQLFLSNSKPEVREPIMARGNIGLKNVKKRLDLLYPADHELNIVEEPESFSVHLKIRLIGLPASADTNEIVNPIKGYAVA